MASGTPPGGEVGKRAAAADWLPDDLLLSVLSHLPQREANLCEGAVLLTSRCVEALALVCLLLLSSL